MVDDGTVGLARELGTTRLPKDDLVKITRINQTAGEVRGSEVGLLTDYNLKTLLNTQAQFYRQISCRSDEMRC